MWPLWLNCFHVCKFTNILFDIKYLQKFEIQLVIFIFERKCFGCDCFLGPLFNGRIILSQSVKLIILPLEKEGREILG